MRAAQVVAPATLLLAVAVGCGVAMGPRSAEPARWDSMTADQRIDYMKTTVMPQMKTVFTAFDRHRYEKMTCATCHGDDGAKRQWKMPSPELLLEREAVNDGHHGGELDVFMREQVAPEMARMLGQAPDCFSCHTPDD
jgi:hypothetical protein